MQNPDSIALPSIIPGHDRARAQGTGRFIRSDESMRRDAEALRLRSKGRTLQAISDELGYGGSSNVSRALKRATDEILVEDVDTYRATELARLDRMIEAAEAILARNHVTVSHGKVITQIVRPAVKCENDECPGKDCPLCVPEVRAPIYDDGPALQAINTIQRLSESRRRLLGTDAPTKIDATVHNVDEVDRELEQMIREARAKQGLAQETL